MKKRILRFSVIFIFAALLVCALAIGANAASATCPVTGGSHNAGPAADCDSPCVCTECGEELTPKLGHNPGAPATCGSAQTCTTCGEVIKEALGYDHCVGDIEAPTCTQDQFCRVCTRRMAKATGHSPVGTADCGHGVKCSVCSAFTENATGQHTFDWANATVVREATADSPKIVNVKCTTCERTYERSYQATINDSTGTGSIETTPENIGTSMTIDDSLKVADYADTELAKNNDLLQTFKLTLEKAGGLTGTQTVTIALSEDAKDAADEIKVYAMLEDGSYEEMEIVSVKDGKIQFKTDYYANTQFAFVVENVVENERSGLPVGALIAIIAGGVVLVAAVAVVVVVVLRKKKAGAKEPSAE